MMQTAQIISEGSVAAVARRAREAARALARLSADARNEVLLAAAAAIEANKGKILAANALDVRAAEAAVAAGKMSAAMLARLRISEQRRRANGHAGARSCRACPILWAAAWLQPNSTRVWFSAKKPARSASSALFSKRGPKWCRRSPRSR